MRPLLFCLAAGALASTQPGCIERPYGDGQTSASPRAQFDRSSVREALLTQTPPDMVPVGAVFGGAAELVGYRVEPGALVPGQRARVTLYWRCRHELESWHIFVHLDDATGASDQRIHAEHDPVMGRFPTSAWRSGDLIADPFVVQVGNNPLALFLGFYNEGESRLTLDTPGRGRDDGNNRLWAGNIPLVH